MLIPPISASRGPNDEILIFRPEAYHARLNGSSRIVSIPPIPYSHFFECVKLAVRANAEAIPTHGSGGCLYIRVVVFGCGAQLPVVPSREYLCVVFVQPMMSYTSSKSLKALVLDEFDRTAPLGPGSAKTGAIYAPMMRWSAMAREKGYLLTLLLDSQRHEEVQEFLSLSLLGVKSDVGLGSHTLVASNSRTIIPSITIDSCMMLADWMGWRTERRPVSIFFRRLR